MVALWRKGGFVPEQLSRVHLSAGDALVLQGDDEALARVRQDPDFLMLVPFHGEARRPRKALLAGAILLGTIAVASLHWMSLAMAMLAGAAVMLLTRCLSPRQAYRAIDAPMYLFVAGAIPLGAAMKQSGAADLQSPRLELAFEEAILVGLKVDRELRLGHTGETTDPAVGAEEWGEAGQI